MCRTPLILGACMLLAACTPDETIKPTTDLISPTATIQAMSDDPFTKGAATADYPTYKARGANQFYVRLWADTTGILKKDAICGSGGVINQFLKAAGRVFDVKSQKALLIKLSLQTQLGISLQNIPLALIGRIKNPGTGDIECIAQDVGTTLTPNFLIKPDSVFTYTLEVTEIDSVDSRAAITAAKTAADVVRALSVFSPSGALSLLTASSGKIDVGADVANRLGGIVDEAISKAFTSPSSITIKQKSIELLHENESSDTLVAKWGDLELRFFPKYRESILPDKIMQNDDVNYVLGLQDAARGKSLQQLLDSGDLEQDYGVSTQIINAARSSLNRSEIEKFCRGLRTYTQSSLLMTQADSLKVRYFVLRLFMPEYFESDSDLRRANVVNDNCFSQSEAEELQKANPALLIPTTSSTKAQQIGDIDKALQKEIWRISFSNTEMNKQTAFSKDFRLEIDPSVVSSAELVEAERVSNAAEVERHEAGNIRFLSLESAENFLKTLSGNFKCVGLPDRPPEKLLYPQDIRWFSVLYIPNNQAGYEHNGYALQEQNQLLNVIPALIVNSGGLGTPIREIIIGKVNYINGLSGYDLTQAWPPGASCQKRQAKLSTINELRSQDVTSQ